jgi:thiol-disulfide isomerase/thioredoxin
MDPRSKRLSKGRILFWLGGAALASGFVLLTVLNPNTGGRPNRIESNERIKNVSILNAQGEAVGLVDELTRLHAGKKVIVSLWATWCEPCVSEIQGIEKARDRLTRDNTVVFLVNIDGGSPDKAIPEVKAWMIAQRIKEETYFDFDDAMAHQFQFNGIPFSIGLGKDLRQRWTHLGPLDVSDPDVGVGD